MTISVAVVILLLFVVSVWLFITENEKNKKLPSIYGWGILLLSGALSLASFFASSGISVTSMIASVMFVGNVTGLTVIIAYLLMKKEKNLSVNWVDKFSFAISIVIVVFWCISSNAYHTNIALQILMMVGFSVLVNNICKKKESAESFLFWGLALITSLLSFIPAYGEGNSLAIIGSWRATISIGVLLSVMAYYHRRNKTHLEATQ